jgi:hypothetical protein
MSNQFRTLDPNEVKSFHLWARENDTPKHRASMNSYHPEVRAEWARIDAIIDHPTTVAIKEYRYGTDHLYLSSKFPQFTSVGCYTILYVCADNSYLCAQCVNGENGSEVGSDTLDPQWTVTTASLYDEGPTLQCNHCDAEIKSSYGDPDAPKINLDNMDRTDGTVLVTCDDSDVKNHQSIAGSNWEAPSDMSGAYALISDTSDLVAELEEEGYNVDSSEYCPN